MKELANWVEYIVLWILVSSSSDERGKEAYVKLDKSRTTLS